MIDGVSYIFIIPPIIVLLIALGLIISKIIKGNYKAAFISLLRVLVFGGFILFVIFIVWTSLYFSSKGH